MTRALARALVVAFALAPNGGALAESPDISLRVTLDPPVIPFHQYAVYTVSVEAPADADIRFEPMLEKFGGLQVTSGPQRSTVPIEGDRMRVSETYHIEGINPGDYFIEPASVSINEQKRSVSSPALRLRDLTPDERAEAEKFAGIIEPPPVRPEWWRDWRFWSAVVLAALLLGSLVVYVVRRRPRIETVAAPVPPWEVAYQRLRELDMRNLPKLGKYGLFFVDLSSILRYYIEDRFHLHAPEQTTPEFLTALAESKVLDEDHQHFLERFLYLSDRVKFAQYQPAVGDMEQSFVDVLKFVDDTVPAPEAPPREQAA